MRRFILVFMMVLLPLQWSWAAAASACEHEREREKTHFGHHEHEHAAPGDAGHAPQAAQDEDTPQGSHPDCQVCHGMGAACVMSPSAPGPAWSTDGPSTPYGQFLPDPPLENLLRPPLALVA
jgi:hypothetical protein